MERDNNCPENVHQNRQENDNNDENHVDISVTTIHTRFRELKRNVQNELFMTLEQFDLGYDNYYWMHAKNELDHVKKLIDSIHKDLGEIQTIMLDLDRDFSRYLNSVHRKIRGNLPLSRRNLIKSDVEDLDDWYRCMITFLDEELAFITKKKMLVQDSYIRPVKRKSLYETLEQFNDTCNGAEFDLPYLERYIEKHYPPMSYSMLLNNDAASEINSRLFALNEIEYLCQNAPQPLREEIPHFLSNHLPDEALYKLRKGFKIDSGREFHPIIPKNLLTFEVLRKFLAAEKLCIPIKILSQVIEVDKDLEKYAGNKVLARKTATISVEEANELVKNGKISVKQLFPLIPPFNPNAPFQDFEIKKWLLLTEEEMFVQAKSSVETEKLDDDPWMQQ